MGIAATRGIDHSGGNHRIDLLFVAAFDQRSPVGASRHDNCLQASGQLGNALASTLLDDACLVVVDGQRLREGNHAHDFVTVKQRHRLAKIESGATIAQAAALPVKSFPAESSIAPGWKAEI